MKKCRCGAELKNDTYGDRCEDCFASAAYWFDGDPNVRVQQEDNSRVTDKDAMRPHRNDRRMK